MKISKINMNGFGKFEQTAYDLDGQLTLFYGDNEAGKSTIMGFIRTMLFGFPNRNYMAERYEPVYGGRHGGSLILCDEAGMQYHVERYDLGKQSSVQMKLAMDDGTVGGEAELRQLLGGVSSEVFYHVFAFSLSELQEIRTLQSAEVNRFLLSAGTGIGGATMIAAEKQLTGQMDQLFRPRGQVQPLNQLAVQLQEAEQQLAASRAMSEQYDLHVKEVQACDAEIEQLQVEMAEANAKRDWYERCLRGHEDWTLWQSLKQQLSELRAAGIGDNVTPASSAMSGQLAAGRQGPSKRPRFIGVSNQRVMMLLLSLNLVIPGLLFVLDQRIASIIAFVVIAIGSGIVFRAHSLQKAAVLQEEETKKAQMLELQQEIQQLEHYLRALAGEEGLAVMTQQWHETDYQTLRRLLLKWQDRSESLAYQRNEWHNRKGRLEGELDRLKAEQQVGRQQQHYEELLASFQQLMGQWASSALCLALLQQTKAVTDEAQHPKLMRQASQYFATMTEQQFVRVMAPLDEGVVKVERATGEVIDASLLSRGTAEQLYLALRFALIARFKTVPLPIVMDDILVNFDATRLRNTLSICAELSKQRQIILFTCHPHIRDQLAAIAPDHQCIAL